MLFKENRLIPAGDGLLIGRNPRLSILPRKGFFKVFYSFHTNKLMLGSYLGKWYEVIEDDPAGKLETKGIRPKCIALTLKWARNSSEILHESGRAIISVDHRGRPILTWGTGRKRRMLTCFSECIRPGLTTVYLKAGRECEPFPILFEN